MPKPFAFKLDKVLEYRTQLEEQAKAALAQAQAAFDAQRDAVADLRARMEAHAAKEAESQKSANDMWLWRQYQQALEGDIAAAEMELSKLELNLHNCRQTAVDRARERKLLDTLKENQAKLHKAEERAREEKEYDEMAIIRRQSQDI